MRAFGLLPLLLVCLLPVPAEGEARHALDGEYAFYTTAKVDGRPLCSERWRFEPAGKMTIFSGDEISKDSFHTEFTGGDNWLVRRWLSANGLPDCLGRKTTVVPSWEWRIFFYQAKDGSYVLCDPPRAPRILSCFGRLVRALES